MAVRARERLLNAARKLFYAEGIRAVGVERLLEESEVGRASFYRHFASKDDLVAAMLNDYDREYRTWLNARVNDLGGNPLAVFDAAAERAVQTGFRGCAFLNAMAEVGDPDDPVHRLATEHKRSVTSYLAKLLTSNSVAAPQEAASRWMMLLDGAVVTAGYERTTTPFTRARALAAKDLEPAPSR